VVRAIAAGIDGLHDGAVEARGAQSPGHAGEGPCAVEDVRAVQLVADGLPRADVGRSDGPEAEEATESVPSLVFEVIAHPRHPEKGVGSDVEAVGADAPEFRETRIGPGVEVPRIDVDLRAHERGPRLELRRPALCVGEGAAVVVGRDGADFERVGVAAVRDLRLKGRRRKPVDGPDARPRSGAERQRSREVIQAVRESGARRERENGRSREDGRKTHIQVPLSTIRNDKCPDFPYPTTFLKRLRSAFGCGKSGIYKELLVFL